MVVRCAASMCSNTQDKTKDITYHRFPKDVELCNKWATLCHRFDLVDNENGKCNKSQRLCFIHFEPHCYLSSGNICKDAVPSKFDWTAPFSISDNQKDTSSTNICEISGQIIDEENVLDLPDPECSASIAVCSTPILGRTHSSSEMTNISNISRVTCTSPTTGDGDSSVTKRLNEVMPYGPKFLVEKIECRNHILRNYSQKLMNVMDKVPNLNSQNHALYL